MKSIIETNNLTKNFKELCAVDNVNLQIKENEIFALLGVNGAGKTTTIRMLSCLSKPTSGDAKLNDFSILTDSQKIKEIINISPQETAIGQNLTVRENIDFVAEIYGIKKEERNKKIDDILEKFNLTEVSKKKAKVLSGGMQRRLSIAMALITDPKILFLDEPSLGLDVLARRELWEVIKQLKNTITIILTTHYMEEAEYLADRVGIMVKGKLVEVDTPKALVKKTKAKNFEEAFVKIASEEVKI